MGTFRVFLPLETIQGASYSLTGLYQDPLPAEKGKTTARLSTIVRVDNIPPGHRVRPIAVWQGTLSFRPSGPPGNFDIADPQGTIKGDFVIARLPFDHDLLTANLNSSQSLWVIPPYYAIYQDLTLTSSYLNTVILPLLKHRELAVFDENGQELESDTDLVKAFANGKAGVNFEVSKDTPFYLPEIETKDSVPILLKLTFGLVAGDENFLLEEPLYPIEGLHFERFPVEGLYQLIINRNPSLLGKGQSGDPLLSAMLGAPRYTTLTLAEEAFLPQPGDPFEELYPMGMPTLEWGEFEYAWWNDSIQKWVTGLVPSSGRIHVPPKNPLRLAHAATGNDRMLNVLSPDLPVPTSWPAGETPLTSLATGGTLVLRGAPMLYKQDWVKRWIVTYRHRANVHNPARTFFYLRYWKENPEVPWALLAHLVSRNAGYQMSDLKRYIKYVENGAVFLSPALNVLEELVIQLGVEQVKEILEAMFALLESGNFLILRDVFPALSVYAWAKGMYKREGTASLPRIDSLFDMLASDQVFEVDPWIVERWKTFFTKAANNSWWDGLDNPATDPIVREHSLALIINEQSYIEVRLVNPVGENRYLNRFSSLINLNTIFSFMASQRLTRVLIVKAKEQHVTADDILLYVVGDFSNLSDRIIAGGELFTGVFLKDSNVCRLVRNWASAETENQHSGSRMDYDSFNYDRDLNSAVLPGGKTYSDRIDKHENSFEWPPIIPREHPDYQHIHLKPDTLPWSLSGQVSSVDQWLQRQYVGILETQKITADRELVEILI